MESPVSLQILRPPRNSQGTNCPRHASNCRTLDSYAKNVLERIRKTIFECENKEEMSVEML